MNLLIAAQHFLFLLLALFFLIFFLQFLLFLCNYVASHSTNNEQDYIDTPE